MKPAALAFAIALCLLSPTICSAAPAHADSKVRTFAPGSDQPKVSGYAEVVYSTEDSHGSNRRDRIWFQGRHRYRIESKTLDGNLDSSTIEVYDGRLVYAIAVYQDQRRTTPWSAVPESWMPGFLDVYLLSGSGQTMHNAVLVGRERVQGLRAEHWRGQNLTGATLNVWKSVDPRFPLVLAWAVKSPTLSSAWRISKLDISRPIPDYVFTPQVNPKSGLHAILRMPYRPFPVVLTLHVLLLLWYVGFVCYFARKPCGGRSWLGSCLLFGNAGMMLMYASRSKLVSYLLFGTAGMLLLCANRVPSEHWHQMSDIPVGLLLSLFTCAAMALMWRLAGPPGDVSLFKDTKWPVAGYALLAAAAGFALQVARQQTFVKSLEIGHWTVPFLPITLLSVILFAVPFAALEELVFRGYVFQALQNRFQRPAATIVIQAVLFAAYHIPRDLRLCGASAALGVDLVYLTLFGIAFGLLRWRYRNLGAPFLVHAAYNVAFLYVSSTATLSFLRALPH